jgi:type I restriction enzyme S subunit
MDGYFYMNIWTRDGEYVNQRIARVRQINLSTLLLKYQIAPAIKLKESQSKGSTVGHLSDKDLKGLNVIIPNNNSITKQFDLLSINIIIRKQEIAYLTAHRDRLLPLLMNGQVEVR